MNNGCKYCIDKCNTCKFSGCQLHANDGGKFYHMCRVTGPSKYIQDGKYCKECGNKLSET